MDYMEYTEGKYGFVLIEEKKNKRYFLVDYENVKHHAFEGMEELRAEDTLIVFYTENANTMPISLFRPLADSPAEVLFFNVACGMPNALDLQLSSYIGFIIGDDPEAECYIISADKGFDFVINFWHDRQKIIRRIINIKGDIAPVNPVESSEAKEQTINTASEEESEFDQTMKTIGLTKAQALQMRFIINQCQNMKEEKQRLSQANSLIGKTFGSPNQKRFYAAIKPFLK